MSKDELRALAEKIAGEAYALIWGDEAKPDHAKKTDAYRAALWAVHQAAAALATAQDDGR